MALALKSGIELARQHAGRFRIVTYAEFRSKSTQVAARILEQYADAPRGVVIAPILGGGGLPARLIVDALLPFGVIQAVVPCQIRRYSGVDDAGEAELLLPLAAKRVKGQIVIGIDDLVDGGQTLTAFREHALAQGASEVDTAVIYAKPHSSYVPGYTAEDGVTQWMVLPGEEHTFMHEIAQNDADVRELEAPELRAYFETLGLDAYIVEEWFKLQ